MHSEDSLPRCGQEGFLATLSREELSSLPYDDVLEVASEYIPSSYFISRSQDDEDLERDSEIILERRVKGAGQKPQRSGKQKTWTWLA